MGQILPEAWSPLATGQFGLLSRRQALAAGLKPSGIELLIKRGIWEIAHPSVYRVVGSSQAWPHKQMAAFLWAKQNTAVSHASAARLHGFDKYRENDAVDLISRWIMKPPEGIKLHRSRTMSTGQICELHGMLVTTVARTIFDLHASDAKEGARVMDEALRRNMVQIGELEFVAGLNRGKGQSSTPEFERLIDDRRTGGHTDSALETDVVAFLEEHAFPAHVRQFHVAVPGRVTAQVDFAWPELRVCLQAHGKGHQQGKVWNSDQSVENAIRGAGWEVVIVTRKILNQQPRELLADLKSAFARAKSSLLVGVRQKA